MARGKTINMFLMDGEAHGRVKASISNWIGVGFKIPRSHLALCRDRSEFSQSSVYFLFGTSPSGKAAVYIGQAGMRKNGGAILTRLLEHDKNPDKSFWTEAVVFTTSNNVFGPTELSFLENRFCNDAIKAGRYEVTNANDPTPGNITEEKESELDEFADYAHLILGVFGYKVFEALEKAPAILASSANSELPSSPPLLQKVAADFVRIPALPVRSENMKIADYIRSALTNLSNAGYSFSSEEIATMCSSEWSKKVFHTKHPFMKRCIAGATDNKDMYGKYVRFWRDPFTFGDNTVLISKEWYKDDFSKFDAWYMSLE